MHPPLDGYLGSFQFLAPVNSAGTSNYVKRPYGTWEKKGLQAVDGPFPTYQNCLGSFEESQFQDAPSPVKSKSLGVGTRHLYIFKAPSESSSRQPVLTVIALGYLARNEISGSKGLFFFSFEDIAKLLSKVVPVATPPAEYEVPCPCGVVSSPKLY